MLDSAAESLARLRRAKAGLAKSGSTKLGLGPDVGTYLAGLIKRPFVRRDRRGPKALLLLGVNKAHKLEREWRLAEAEEQWKALLAAHPNEPLSHAGYGGVLRKMNRCEEGRAILEAAALRFPNDRNVMAERATVAHRQGNFDEALALSLAIIDRFPAKPQGYEAAGRVYRDLRRFEEADAILLAGRQQCPNRLGLATEYAANADVNGDWNEGLARWRQVHSDFPDAAFGFAGVGAAFKRLKRYDEADAVLAAGMARFPEDANLGVNHAWVADERGDWSEALARWESLGSRFPRDPRVRKGWIESQGKANLAQIDLLVEGAAPGSEAGAGPPPARPARAVPLTADLQHRDLFMRFESLGENCELGFAQQHFGAEPLGLLRWAGISFDKLLEGLDNAFEGVGSPEATELGLNPSNHEYYTSDKNFGLNMHTFMLRDEGNEHRIFQKLCRRLKYLCDKLLDDLRLGEKIFVFQSGLPLADDDLVRLHAAMRRYGPAKLLCVRPQDGVHAPGSVHVLGEGLMAGYIDRIGYDGKRWAVSFDLWRQLCQRAVAIVDAQAPAALADPVSDG